MNRQELLDALLQTAEDRQLTRGERRALKAVLEETALDARGRRAVESDVLTAVASLMRDPRDRELVGWLAEVLPLLDPEPAPEVTSRAYFGPGDPMVETVVRLIRGTERRLDVAMFTITDDRIADALVQAHSRGVRVRILTDDDKAYDRGSDIDRFRGAGIPVAVDGSPEHFHHKFALFDGARLVTGSYNWTRGADSVNRENFLVTDDAGLVGAYARAFGEMWDELR